MIGLRVKACVISVVLFAVACSAKKPDQPPGSPESPAEAGAEKWDNGALLLPLDSPLVVSVRLSVLFDGLERLKDWLIAEPAMFGEDGVAFTQRTQAGWHTINAYFGGDAFSPTGLRARGLDPDAPILAGFYPQSRDEKRWTRAVESVLRDELGVVPGFPISPMTYQLFERGGALPEGTHARLARVEPPEQGPSGFRVVLRVSDRERLQQTAQSLLVAAGFRLFPSKYDEGREEQTFWSENRYFPTVALHFVGEHLVADVIAPSLRLQPSPRVTRDSLDAAHERLLRGVDEVAAGRPRAPAPAGEPTVALSIDHAMYADILRLVRYRRMIQAMDSFSADRRDAELTHPLTEEIAGIETWDVGASQFSGTVFGLDVAPSDTQAGAISMTMFGAGELPTLDTSMQAPSLRPAERSIGVGVQLGAMRREDWKTWFSKPFTDELLAIETNELPVHALPALLRHMALLAGGTVPHELAGELDPTIDPLLVHGLDGVDYIELASTPDARIERGAMLVSMVFGSGADEGLTNAQQLVEALLAGFSEEVDVMTLTPAELQTTTTTPYGTSEVHQHLTASGEQRALLTGVSIGAERMQGEVASLQERPIHDVLFAHIEPVALLSLIREAADRSDHQLDFDIFVQRIGALQLHFGPHEASRGRALTLSATLGVPPKIP